MIEIRAAQPGDETSIQVLLQQLGYAANLDDLKHRLDVLAKHAEDPVLVAIEDGTILGLIALHWAIILFSADPVARITTLVVNEQARGKGVGRRLVEAGAGLARQAGCQVLELTTALHRTEAQAFYKSIGFTASSLRLHRDLS